MMKSSRVVQVNLLKTMSFFSLHVQVIGYRGYKTCYV
jgi:hypothetical protein